MEIRAMRFSDLLQELPPEKNSQTALVYGSQSYSYGELKQAAELFAGQLIKKGLKPGDHIGLWSYNCLEWLAVFFGIVRAGGVAVLLNYSLSANELAELLTFTDCRWLVYGQNNEIQRDEKAAEKLAAAVGIAKENLINIQFEKNSWPSELDFVLPPEPPASEISRKAAVIILTTGTTARPKAVQLSQYAISNNAQESGAILGDMVGERALVALPLFHAYGLIFSLSYLRRGAAIYFADALTAERISNLLLEQQITDLASVGTIYLMLLQHPDFEEKIAPLLHLCVVGGGFTTPVQMMRLDLAFSQAKFVCGYGQTEAAPVISLSSPQDSIERRASTVGKPLPHLEVKILDAQQNFAPSGKMGEILVRGYNLMNGYYKLPPEKQAIDAEGWLHTGDLGYLDEEGYLHFAGRAKEVIIRGGENISPSEVESEISQCESIREVKVLGAAHALYGESVEACLVVPNPADFDEEQIRRQLKARLASYKIPEHFFLYSQFPLQTNGKLDLRSLRLSMLDRLQTLSIQEALEAGICVAELSVKNTVYTVVPVTSMLEKLAANLGFGESGARRVCLAVEEMLLERIGNAYEEVGDINIRLVLRANWLSVQFKDQGSLYVLEKNTANSWSAKIILKMVDHFRTIYTQNKQPVYCLDFLYDQAFNIQSFLKEQSPKLIQTMP